MRAAATLRREAREAAKWRGHSMRPFSRLEGRAATAVCRVCGATVTINVRPLPNEIDIGGNAVAVGCKP